MKIQKKRVDLVFWSHFHKSVLGFYPILYVAHDPLILSVVKIYKRSLGQMS